MKFRRMTFIIKEKKNLKIVMRVIKVGKMVKFNVDFPVIEIIKVNESTLTAHTPTHLSD